MPTASVSLNVLADMIDRMTQRMLIFTTTPSGSRTQGKRQFPRLCNNNANSQQEQSPNDTVFCAC